MSATARGVEVSRRGELSALAVGQNVVGFGGVLNDDGDGECQFAQESIVPHSDKDVVSSGGGGCRARAQSAFARVDGKGSRVAFEFIPQSAVLVQRRDGDDGEDSAFGESAWGGQHIFVVVVVVVAGVQRGLRRRRDGFQLDGEGDVGVVESVLRRGDGEGGHCHFAGAQPFVQEEGESFGRFKRGVQRVVAAKVESFGVVFGGGQGNARFARGVEGHAAGISGDDRLGDVSARVGDGLVGAEVPRQRQFQHICHAGGSYEVVGCGLGHKGVSSRLGDVAFGGDDAAPRN